MLAVLRNRSPFDRIVERRHFHDLGNLLLAFVVFWTYVSFSQFIIIYAGNLPREIDWYLHRIAGHWRWVAGFLAVFHFLVPFALLLFRVMKQDVRRLVWIAGWILAVVVLGVYWQVQPTFFPDGLHVHWLDFTAFVGIGGLWIALFTWNLSLQPLLARNDPRKEFRLKAAPRGSTA